VFLRAYQSLVTPISILAIMGSQLISFGSVSTAFGIPYDIAVIIGVIVIIIYTYTSGMWGVAVSAFIQLAICIVFLPIVAYISLKLVGDNPLLMLQSMVKEPFFPGNKSISDFMYT
ncbi:sodium:solute symporter family transporter, partial [Mammaliicoccus sciuri]